MLGALESTGGGLPRPQGEPERDSGADRLDAEHDDGESEPASSERLEQEDRLDHRDRTDREQEPGALQRQHVLDGQVGPGQHGERDAEDEQRVDGEQPVGAECGANQQPRRQAKISRHGIAATPTIASDLPSTGRVSSPAARRRETSGTR